MELTATQINALQVVLDFVEKWNKQDEDILVAEAQGILEEFLDSQYYK